MRCFVVRMLAVLVLASGVGAQAMAAFPFVENFNDDAANWKRTSAGVDATYVASGGPDSGPYVSNVFALPAYTPPHPMFGAAASIVFRAQEEFDSSNDEYTGNWITAGIKEVTAYVRHNAGVPIMYNLRIADPGNTPGASYSTINVPSGVWTKLIVDVSESSPQNLTFGGSTYQGVFDNIGHIQVSAVIPENWPGGIPVTFDLDRVTIAVPEPATIALAGSALAGVALLARRRR